MNSVQRVKAICKERKIAISRLERDLGFANGYIGQLRKGTLPDDRLAAISEYLNVPTQVLMGKCEEAQKNIPAVQSDNEDSTTKELLDIIQNGTDEDRQTLLEMYQLLKRREKR